MARGELTPDACSVDVSTGMLFIADSGHDRGDYYTPGLFSKRTLGGTLGGSSSMSALESSTAASGDGPGRHVSPCPGMSHPGMPNPDSNPDPDSNPNPDLMTTSLRHISRAGLAARAGLLAVCDSGKWQLEAAALRRPPTRALVGDRAILIY